MVLEEDGTDGDGIPADAVVVEGDVEGGGSGGIGGGACWKEIMAWLCRSGAGSIGIGGRRGEGAAPAAVDASDTDEISLHSIEEEVIGLTRSSSGGGRGGGGGGTGTATALVRMPCCGGGRITLPPLLLTRTCASTVMGAADPGSVLESLWQSETLPSAALLRTDCCCRTGGGGGGARR